MSRKSARGNERCKSRDNVLVCWLKVRAVAVHTARCVWTLTCVLQVKTHRSEIQVCVVRAGCCCCCLVTAVQNLDLLACRKPNAYQMFASIAVSQWLRRLLPAPVCFLHKVSPDTRGRTQALKVTTVRVSQWQYMNSLRTFKEQIHVITSVARHCML